MRLIDADALFKAISDGEYTTGNIFKDMELQDFIKSMPTAYDIDEVVEQLESMFGCDPMYFGEDAKWAVDRAIEIVKGGAK